MKLLNKNRAIAILLAAGMTAALAGCGPTANPATGETATGEEATAEAATSETAAGESADYSYLADFDMNSHFDENGYMKGVKASDYVTLAKGYDTMTLAADLDTVSDEEVDDYITNTILANYTTTEKNTERAAKDGDSVNIDYVGSVDGVEFEGGSSKAAGDSGYDLTLGSGTFIDGFEDQIVGHKPGESFDVTVTFPDPYTNPDLAGKEAVFKTELHHINEEVSPELTDAWVLENLKESAGVENVDELKVFVKDTLLYDKKTSPVYKSLQESATIVDERPQELTDYFKDFALYSAYSTAQQYGIDLDTVLSASGYENAQAFLDAQSDSINAMVDQTLLIQAVAEDEGIKADTANTTENFHRYFGTPDPSDLFDQYGENYVKGIMLQSLVMQHMMDNASYTG